MTTGAAAGPEASRNWSAVVRTRQSLHSTVRSRRSLSTRQPPTRSRIDRAVAHLARAERTGNQESARQALALSDGVLARDNGSLPALFNRALALEYLDRPEDAAAAWRAYLARDGDSPWAEEVRQRHLR